MKQHKGKEAWTKTHDKNTHQHMLPVCLVQLTPTSRGMLHQEKSDPAAAAAVAAAAHELTAQRSTAAPSRQLASEHACPAEQAELLVAQAALQRLHLTLGLFGAALHHPQPLTQPLNLPCSMHTHAPSTRRRPTATAR